LISGEKIRFFFFFFLNKHVYKKFNTYLTFTNNTLWLTSKFNQGLFLSDKCADPFLKTHKLARNCRSFWFCDSGRSFPMCCPINTSYKDDIGCVPDGTCNHRCPPRDFGGLVINNPNQANNQEMVTTPIPMPLKKKGLVKLFVVRSSKINVYIPKLRESLQGHLYIVQKTKPINKTTKISENKAKNCFVRFERNQKSNMPQGRFTYAWKRVNKPIVTRFRNVPNKVEYNSKNEKIYNLKSKTKYQTFPSQSTYQIPHFMRIALPYTWLNVNEMSRIYTCTLCLLPLY